MSVHPSLKKIQWYDPKVMDTLKRNLGLGAQEALIKGASFGRVSFEHVPLEELYPGQTYFHANNPKIRRAEKSFFGAGLC